MICLKAGNECFRISPIVQTEMSVFTLTIFICPNCNLAHAPILFAVVLIPMLCLLFAR